MERGEAQTQEEVVACPYQREGEGEEEQGVEPDWGDQQEERPMEEPEGGDLDSAHLSLSELVLQTVHHICQTKP